VSPGADTIDRKKQVLNILRLLRKAYPSPKTALNFKTPFELLVATVLSAQTTDVHVNKVTKVLFRKYRGTEDFATTPLDELKKDISSVNFFNNKAKSIRGSAIRVMGEFGGTVPRTMEELITLPGVARKTANIILSNAYGIIEGIAVDTHVARLSGRLGLTAEKDPVKIERNLMEVTPRKDWPALSHLLIFHGRSVCKVRKPMHSECVLYPICPSRDI
jgi:endonuclease-3